ncbi:hypothetical protein [Alishewanella longhuensis]
MRAFFAKNLWLLLFLGLVLLHLISVLQPLLTSSFASKAQQDKAALVIMDRSQIFTEERVSNFSRLFAIEPISFIVEEKNIEQEKTLPEIKLLNAYQPVLIAVDQIDNIYTARLIITDENQNRLTSLRQDDILHGYKATEISLNGVTFELNESHDDASLPAQIVLNIFSRNTPNAN